MWNIFTTYHLRDDDLYFFFRLTLAILTTIFVLSPIYFYKLLLLSYHGDAANSNIRFVTINRQQTLHFNNDYAPYQYTVFANFRCDGLVESALSVVALKMHSPDDSSAGTIIVLHTKSSHVSFYLTISCFQSIVFDIDQVIYDMK